MEDNTGLRLRKGIAAEIEYVVETGAFAEGKEVARKIEREVIVKRRFDDALLYLPKGG
jgi:hypothetical protein